MPSVKFDSCVPNPGVKNCAGYSPVNCTSCQSLFYRNPSTISSFFYDSFLTAPPTFAFQILQTLLSFNNGSYSSFFPQYVCERSDLQYCQTYLNKSACVTCQDGAFLNPNLTCSLWPQGGVPNCDIYSSVSTCSVCSQGYRPTADRMSCVPIVAIAGCVKYSGSDVSNICIACDKAFYLSGTGCVNRTFFDTNCANYSLSADSCMACADKFVLKSDSQGCGPMINNCSQITVNQVDAAVNSTTLKFNSSCDVCMPGFVLNTASTNSTIDACFAGNLTNCYIYSNFTAGKYTCQTCKNGFYMNVTSGECVNQTTIANCDYPSTSTFGQCSYCSLGYTLFNLKKVCRQAISIPNCAKFNSTTTCQTCMPSYYLANNNCTRIPTSMIGCLNVTVSDALNLMCNSCATGYYLYLGSCYPAQPLIGDNCQNITYNTDSGNFQCDSCKPGFYERLVSAYPMCYNQTMLTTLNNKTNISNCLVHAENMTCLACADGYAISSDRVCVLNTTCTAVLSYELRAVGSLYALGRKNVCVSNGMTNCTNFIPSLTADETVCSICSSKSLTVIDTTYTTTVTNSYTFNPVTRVPKIIECPDASTITLNGKNATGAQANCSYYGKDTLPNSNNAVYGCTRCANGYSSIVATVTSNLYTVDTCTAITSCDLSINVQGISANLNALLSCQKCTIGVPIINVVYLNDKSIYVYKTGNMSTTCGDTAISNCAIVLNVFTNQTTLEHQATCGACLGGYFLSNGTCFIIPKCKQSDAYTLNSCSVCEDGYAFPYISNSGINYSSCITVGSYLNCLAYVADVNDANGLTPGYCAICKKDYFKNLDGFCEQVSIPRCTTIQDSPAVERVALPHLFDLASAAAGIGGCSACPSGFSIVAYDNQFVCGSSSYSNSTLPNNTKFISACITYSSSKTVNSFQLKCTQCSSGFVLSYDEMYCYSNTAIPNCIQASDSSTCLECAAGYTLVSFKCVFNSIASCKTYAASSSQLTCLGCQSGYYLSSVSNKCLAGKVANCMTYDSDENSCTSCIPGYQLVARFNDASVFCFKMAPQFNCTATDSVEYANGNLVCTDCIANNVLVDVQANETNTDCTPFPLVDKCKIYSSAQISDVNAFNCLQCDSLNYLDSKVCKNLTMVGNCMKYSPTSDACVICNSKYFLSNNTCQPYPSGIYNCGVYVNATYCSACVGSFYASNGECLPVTRELPNCAVYKTNSTCSTCAVGYYVNATNASQCILSAATNCSTYTSSGNCQSCASRYYMTSTGNCAKITDDNCLSVVNGQCMFCKTTLYPSGLGCKVPTSVIQNCTFYESATTCSMCDAGFSLSLNRTVCLTDYNEFAASSCQVSSVVSQPVCSLCRPGYTFVNGVCVECGGGSCMVCSTTNINQCAVCLPGNYMKEDMICYPNDGSPKPTTNTVPTNTTGNGTGTLNAKVLELFVVIWLLFFALN